MKNRLIKSNNENKIDIKQYVDDYFMMNEDEFTYFIEKRNKGEWDDKYYQEIKDKYLEPAVDEVMDAILYENNIKDDELNEIRKEVESTYLSEFKNFFNDSDFYGIRSHNYNYSHDDEDDRYHGYGHGHNYNYDYNKDDEYYKGDDHYKGDEYLTREMP